MRSFPRHETERRLFIRKRAHLHGSVRMGDELRLPAPRRNKRSLRLTVYGLWRVSVVLAVSCGYPPSPWLLRGP
jgi:hypothetical protein